jgi:hypothetical protein
MGQLAKNMGFMGHCERQVCFVSDNHAALIYISCCPVAVERHHKQVHLPP